MGLNHIDDMKHRFSLFEWVHKVPEEFWTGEEKDFQSEWGIIDIKNIDDLPEVKAIYLVISGDKILYVGKSGNLYKRWKNGHHKTTAMVEYPDPVIMWVEFPSLSDIELSNAEQYYINKHKPLLNEV
jgi:hypothetical protein